LAKALGNGMPIGAVLAKEEVAVFQPGDHASTFGGNFLATAAGIAVINKISTPEFIYDVRKKGEFFRDRLEKLGRKYGFIKEVRGKGLMIGAELIEMDAKPIVDKMYERKILINAVGGKVLRFVPPLTVTKEEIDYVIKNLDEVFQEIIDKK
jgi:acetylornithine/N-succinyldiaminopimelate aminotransferase